MLAQRTLHHKFIALEGIDGSGKSTQAALLAQQLATAGHAVHRTFEPTDRKIGKILRGILRGTEKADERVIAGLFLADRLDHILDAADGMLRQLQDGNTVVSDRYYFSSYAYHGVHTDMQWVIAANSMCQQLLRPAATVFIDVPPEVCMARITAGRDKPEHYENLNNLIQVRQKYLEAFAQMEGQETVLIIDGNRPAEEVAADVWQQIRLLPGFGE